MRSVASPGSFAALAALVVARAIVEGSAMSVPCDPKPDAFGPPIAIWALEVAR